MIHKMAALLEILFRRVSVERILCEQEENKIYYDELPDHVCHPDGHSRRKKGHHEHLQGKRL